MLSLTEAEIERFWRYVQRGPGQDCWPWLRGKNRGYGVFTAQGRSFRAHRLALMLEAGIYLTAGVVVRHVGCANPGCCNPAHLVPGSDIDNVTDRVSARRSARGHRNGASKLTADKVLEIRSRSRAGESASNVLAPEFGVSSTTVRLIRDGKIWGWLSEEDDTDVSLEVRDPADVIAEMIRSDP